MTLSQSHVVVDNTLKLPFENPVKINLIQLIETFHTIAHCLWDVVMFVKYVGEKNYVCANLVYVMCNHKDFKTLADSLDSKIFKRGKTMYVRSPFFQIE